VWRRKKRVGIMHSARSAHSRLIRNKQATVRVFRDFAAYWGRQPSINYREKGLQLQLVERGCTAPPPQLPTAASIWLCSDFFCTTCALIRNESRRFHVCSICKCICSPRMKIYSAQLMCARPCCSTSSDQTFASVQIKSVSILFLWVFIYYSDGEFLFLCSFLNQ
jgi:hypothetical protein